MFTEDENNLYTYAKIMLAALLCHQANLLDRLNTSDIKTSGT